jgi:hypothetical protein
MELTPLYHVKNTGFFDLLQAGATGYPVERPVVSRFHPNPATASGSGGTALE